MKSTLWEKNGPRFYSKVDVGSEHVCWPWRGKISAHHGTGIFAFEADGKKKPRAPHLVSWELFHGPLPANLRVESRCKNAHCCNPGHLYTAVKQGRVKRCSSRTLADLTEERFWQNVRVAKDKDCWLWQGATSSFGYGIVTHTRGSKGVTEGAHRYIYYRKNPETKPQAFICHRCDVPACVNPSHLYAGDAQSNNSDRAIRGRSHAKLTEIQVREILQLKAEGKLNQSLMAKQFGVSQSAVYAVANRLNWRHINP